MATIVSDFSLPLSRPMGQGAIHILARLGVSIATPLRRRWVYQRTLAELEHYSARSLEDIGAPGAAPASDRFSPIVFLDWRPRWLMPHQKKAGARPAS